MVFTFCTGLAGAKALQLCCESGPQSPELASWWKNGGYKDVDCRAHWLEIQRSKFPS